MAAIHMIFFPSRTRLAVLQVCNLQGCLLPACRQSLGLALARSVEGTTRKLPDRIEGQRKTDWDSEKVWEIKLSLLYSSQQCVYIPKVTVLWARKWGAGGRERQATLALWGAAELLLCNL